MRLSIDELLSESYAAAVTREKSTFNDLLSAAGGQIVLFGAGVLGRKVLSALASSDLQPIAFIDNNRDLQGTTIESVPVLSPESAADQWGRRALFIVTIFRSTGDAGMASRLEFLRDLGCHHVTTFLPVAWAYSQILPHFAADLPSTILTHRDELDQVNARWSDDVSREIYREQLTWRLRGDFSELSLPAADQYFPPDLIKSDKNEVFVDGGAFDGDTLRSIPWPIAKGWALEPDPVNAAALRRTAPSNVEVVETAIGRSEGRARFHAAGTIGSARSEQGATEVRVAALDDLLARERPTFIKLDIEGDELPTLEGARATLARMQPVVAVCVYHRPDDLWQIPLYLRAQLPDHRLVLRSHANDGFELVAYAIPHKRCAII